VIEDTDDNRQIIRDLLGSAGFEVLEATSGEGGLNKAAEDRPDLILMDIQLPGIDGLEATRRLKSHPTLSDIPIIAVTSYSMSGDEEKCRAAGCDGYIAKPFSPRKLLQLVQDLASPGANG
jgi:two-component system cell cycle response regulator DivK